MKMNGKRWIKVTKIFNPPSANQAGTMSFKLPVGFRTHLVDINAVLPAAKRVSDCFSKPLVRIGEKVQRELATTAELDGLLAVDGPGIVNILGDIPGGGGTVSIPFPFSENYRDQWPAREQFALDLQAGAPDVWVELDYANLAAVPTVSVDLLVEPLELIPAALLNVDKAGNPIIAKWKRNTPPCTGLESQLDNLPQLLKDRLQHLRISDPTGAAITAVELTVDGEVIFDRTKVRNDRDLVRAGLFPVAGHFDIVPDAFEKTSDAWNFNGVTEVKMKVTCDAAGTGRFVTIGRHWGPLE